MFGRLVFASIVFFFNDTATTEIYTLSLHDALPIFQTILMERHPYQQIMPLLKKMQVDRKSTRLNSSHQKISYAVFCLKKKNGYNCEEIDDDLLKKKNGNVLKKIGW